MNYYKVMYDNENSFPEQMVCTTENDYETKYGIGQYDFDKGVKLNDWNNDFTFYYDKSEGYIPTDYLANDLGWFIISHKFKEVMQKLNITNVQYLPIKVQEKNTCVEIFDFNIVNVIGLVDALNLGNSVYKQKKEYLSVMKYALNKKELNDLHILRLKNTSIPVFVSEKLRDELINNKITGIDYQKVKVV